jgi:hypothetical protein
MTVALEQFRRVNPYPGLMVDVDVWRDAHDYHRAQLHLHHLALHGWGIIQGLEIALVDGTDNTVRIEPGLAIDPAGNFISVPQGQTYQITARERQQVYLVLQHRELLSQPATPTEANRASPMTRVVEAYRIQERDRLPEEPYIELARVDFHPGKGAVKAPAKAESPGQNELDLRARVRLGSLAAPMLMAAPRPASSSDGVDNIAPRVDELSEQLDSLMQRVASLASEVEHSPAQPELESLTEEIRRLSARVDSLAAQSSGTPVNRGEVSIDPELVASVVAGQILPMGSRIDDLRQEVDAFSRQLQALSREVESAPAVASPTPMSVGPAADRGVVQLAVGLHSANGWDTHRDGLRFLAREVGADTEWHGRALDPVPPGDAATVDVLYISGSAALTLGDADVDGISGVLDSGGVVIGEGCAAGPGGEAGAREFAMSFVDLAARLGRQLTRVERDHALMHARHVFGDPPPGGRTTPARVLESGGMVYSDADYGCAWQGGPPSQALPRAAIRDALEFGTNLAVFRRNGS